MPSASKRKSSGDIVLLNFTSFVDVLYASARFAPRFVRPAADGGMRECSLLEALKVAVDGTARRNGDVVPQASTDRVLDGLRSFGSGPLVMFPEGVRTNNKAILAFPSAVDELCDWARRQAVPPAVHVRVVCRPVQDCHLGRPVLSVVVRLASQVLPVWPTVSWGRV